MIELLLEMPLSYLKLNLRRKPSLKLLMILKNKEKLENTSKIQKNQSLLRKHQSQDKLFIKIQSTVITKSRILLQAGDLVSFSWQPSLLFSTYYNLLRPTIQFLLSNRWNKTLTHLALNQRRLLPQSLLGSPYSESYFSTNSLWVTFSITSHISKSTITKLMKIFHLLSSMHLVCSSQLP